MNAKKIAAIVLAAVLVFGCGVGATLAWLMDTTPVVTNTFTVGNINIDLYEHTRDNDGNLTQTETTSLEDYHILPGTTEKKDPTVEILANSEDCYVFLQVKEVNNTVTGSNPVKKYITYTIDGTVWSPLMDGENQVSVNGNLVWYATTNYATQDTAKTYNVLTGQQVSYSNDLSKADIDNLYTYNTDGTVNAITKPQLIFKAFAVQQEAATTAAEAWAKIDPAQMLD